MVRLSRLTGVLGSVTLMVSAAPQPVAAHPIHMSYTEIRSSPRGGTVELSVRVYANDFSAAAARYTRTPLGADSLIGPGKGFSYLLANFRLIGRDAKAIALIPCGVVHAGDMLRFCLRANFTAPPTTVRISNSIMTELFHDQVNVVQTRAGNKRASRMFVRGDGWKALP